MGAYFCMGAYKRNVVVVIKMGAYIHGCLFCVGAYYPDFTQYSNNYVHTKLKIEFFLPGIQVVSTMLISI